MKEGGGADHISVGIRMRRKIVPIPSKYLYMVPPGMLNLRKLAFDNYVSCNTIEFVILLLHIHLSFLVRRRVRRPRFGKKAGS